MKKTQMEKVKIVAKSLLHIEATVDKKFPFIVQHPIFEYTTLHIDGNFVDVSTKEGFDVAVKWYTKRIDEIESLYMFFTIIRKPYYLCFLKYAKQYLSNVDFSKMLAEAWTEAESPNDDLNVPIKTSAKWFKEADKKLLMNESEYQTYSGMSNSFTVYRGVTPGHNPDGMSWTTDFEEASWFANRYGEGYVIKGVVRKEHVLAYFSRRDEEEYVIEASNVKNKEKILAKENPKKISERK